MTALMQSHLMREAASSCSDLQYIRQELDQFIDLAADLSSCIPRQPWHRASLLVSAAPSRVLSSEPPAMQMLFDMQHATARRGNNIIEGRKIFDEQIIAPLRQVPEARISHRLPTTGLTRRIDYFTTEFFQQPKCRYTNLRIKLVYITRYKQSHSHTKSTYNISIQ
jgi:hypothetical protein